jgi:hypothetical protein
VDKTTEEGIVEDRATRHAAVWDLLSDGEWHSTMEINAAEVGGSEGCRRLRYLRSEVRKGERSPWVDIVCRKRQGDTSQYEYRLIAVASIPSPPPGQQLLF